MTERDLAFTFVIPVYNRPKEIDELLESLTLQTEKDFEVVIVEDGSDIKSDHIIDKYSKSLNIKYLFKTNSGPGPSRNYGFENAEGNYCIFLDSDCILPPDYFKIVKKTLATGYADAFGGPDKAHESFSNFQKAINYSMTSFFTTGGIRGGSETIDRFYPRSFNMGYSREVFLQTGGFSGMRFGEDIDMSIRILENGFKTMLIREAFVFHKRRTGYRQFFKQVYNSGIARINLYKKHSDSLKPVHFAPAVFVSGIIAILILSCFVSILFILPVLIHFLLLFADASIKNKSITIGLLSVVTSYIQLSGYGLGFINAFWVRIIMGKGEFSAFAKNFYK